MFSVTSLVPFWHFDREKNTNFYYTLIAKEGTLRAHFAIGFEENTVQALGLISTISTSLVACLVQDHQRPVPHAVQLQTDLKMFVFFSCFVFLSLAPSYLLDFFLTENI